MRRLKWWHWLILGVGLATFIAANLVLLAFAPGIQRRVFLAALEHPGRSVEVAHLDAGLGGMEIEGLVWTEGGRRFTVRELRARFSLLAALGSAPLSIEELAAHGVHANVSPAAPPAHSQGRESDGVIAMPAGVSIRRLVADGTLDLGKASAAARRLVFELEGEGVAAGGVARVAWRGRIMASGSAQVAEPPDAAGELLIRPATSPGIDAIPASVHALLAQLADAVVQSPSASGAAVSEAR